MQNTNTAELQKFAERILAARIKIVTAGGDDPSIAEIQAFADAEFNGNTTLAAESLIGRYECEAKTLRDEDAAARAARHVWLNTPENQALMRELNSARSELGEIERRLPGVTRNREEHIKRLEQQGVTHEEALRAANKDHDPDKMHSRATQLRVRIEQLEIHFK